MNGIEIRRIINSIEVEKRFKILKKLKNKNYFEGLSLHNFYCYNFLLVFIIDI